MRVTMQSVMQLLIFVRCILMDPDGIWPCSREADFVRKRRKVLPAEGDSTFGSLRSCDGQQAVLGWVRKLRSSNRWLKLLLKKSSPIRDL